MRRFRRQIFYFSGFDPRGPSFYHELYKTELTKYAVLNGLKIPGISARTSPSAHRTEWSVETEDCITDYAVMRWDDLVRERWRQRPSTFLLRTIGTYWSFLTNVRMREAFTLAPIAIRTFFFPLLLVIFPLLLTAGLAALFGEGYFFSFPLFAVGLYFIFRRWQPRWVLHTLNFNGEFWGDEPVDVQDRCAAHADHIIAVLNRGDYDEVFIVGHSNGCTLVLLVLDRLLAQGTASNSKLKVMTLGQITQLITVHRRGAKLRATLERLSALSLTWLDVSAKADPACIALRGPFSPVAAPKGFRAASARLHRLYSPAIYRRLKADKFNFHFLYLKCTDRMGAYNYPRVTAYGAALESHVAAILTDADI